MNHSAASKFGSLFLDHRAVSERTDSDILKYLCSVFAGLSTVVSMLAVFTASAGAQIDPTSRVQVPLPKAFGEPDSVAVSAAMGAVSDSIPIVVAPGRRGIKPRLSLSYSSMAGTGVAGLGWGIGTGSVERWHGDGAPSVKATIEGTPNDRYSYSLGGAGGELHDENGDGVYRARIESVYRPFRKIGDGWLMYDGQGVSYMFGSSENSRIDGELWLLDRVQDSSGNTILYSYKVECDLASAGQNCGSENNARYLSAIHYTGFAPTFDLGANLITFEYEQRPDQRFSYRRGVREAQNLRLRQITVTARGDRVRRYRLTYNQYAKGPSLLTKVTLVGNDNQSEVTLRTLEYGERNLGWPISVPANLPLKLAEADGKSTGVQLMDVDGDGFADMVNNGEGVYLGDGQGSFAMSASWSNSLVLADAAITNDDGIDTGVRFLDVDSDARPDILVATPDRTEIWLNTGGGWAQDAVWTASLSNLSALNIALIDSNATTNCRAPLCTGFGENPPAGCSAAYCTGDEATDPEDCLTLEEGEEEIPFCEAPNFSDQGTEPFSLVGDVGESKGVEFADVNADGRIDIVWSLKFDQSQFFSELPRIVRAVFLNGGSENPGWYQSDSLSTALASVLTNEGDAAGAFVVENAYQGYSFMDANGDGLADIVRSVEGKQAIYLGNGAGWTLDSDFTNSMISQGIFAFDADFGSQGLVPIDFNDDGLTDYIRARDGQAVQAYLNAGSGWSPDPDMTLKLASSGITFFSEDGKGTGASLTDIDGNGIIDLISAKAEAQDRILLGDTFRSGNIERLVSALGQITDVEWISSTAFDNTTSTGIQGLPITLALVDSMSRSDGRGNTLVTHLDYAGGLYTAKGFRGFRSVSQTPSAGLRTETQFYQDEARASQPFEVRAFDSADKLRSLSESETVVTDAEQGVQQVLLSTTETKRFAADGITVTNTSLTEREYDEYMQATSVFSDPQVEIVGNELTNEYTWMQNLEQGFWSLMAKVTARGPSNGILSEAQTQYGEHGLPTLTKEMVAPGEYLTTSLRYHQFGNVIEVTDRAGGVTAFVYDDTGTFRTQATDALGRIKRSEYDPGFGTLVRDVDASGNATTTSYDVFGGKTKIVAPSDESSLFGTVSYEYSDIGDPEQQSFRLIRTENAGTGDAFETITFFDAAGKIYETREEGPDGLEVITMVEFGEDGQANASSLPFFEGYAPEMIRSDRDDLGRLIGMTDPLGQQITMNYEGFRIDVDDARGNTTTAIVNPAGKPTQISLAVDGVLQTTHYTYDASGRLTTVVDALGSETKITYDGLARRTRLEDPNAGTFVYKYDGEGRLIEQIGPDGKSLMMTYSAAGELIEKRLPDGTTHEFHYGTADMPNAVGQLVEVVDAAGILRLAYDARGRVIERRRTVDGRTYVTGFGYDSMDRVRQVIYPDGFVAHYSYDGGNNLAAVTDKHGRPIAEGFQYNASQRITEFSFGNGVTTNYSYDPLARMLSSSTTTRAGIDLQELLYAYDSANNVLSMDDLTTGRSQAFEYNEANRLVKAVGPYGEEEYEYDAIGNLLKKGDLHFAHDPLRPQRVTCGVKVGTKNGGSKSKASAIDTCAQSLASIDPAQVLSAFAIEYDARGNIVVKGSRLYEYDAENRLIRAGDTKGRIIEQNRYDASGELIVKQDRNEKTVFIDGLYEEGKTHVSRHIRAGSLLVASVVTPRANVMLITQAHPPHDLPIYIAGVSGAGTGLLLLLICLDPNLGRRICRALAGFTAVCRARPLSVALVFVVAFSPISKSVYAKPNNESDREKRFYYHANHLGSVNVVTDDDGEVTARRDYRPYGDPHDWAGANAGPREVLQTFQGQQFDDDTGLYNFKARYYDAELGRFTSADTVVADFNDPRTMNRYAFAGGNPIQFVDPTGRSFWSSVGDFFVNDVGGAFEDAGNWIADHALEIITVVVIVVVVVAIVAAVVLSGGLAAGGLAAVAAFGGLGAAAGFATFGGIALSQGNTVETAAFWQAAGTGAVLGALVGAAIPVAFAPTALFTGGITSVAGSALAGALIGAATGGLEQAISCATGCGGVENLFLPVAQGVIIGAVIGAIGGAIAGKFLQATKGPLKPIIHVFRNTKTARVLKFMIEPGKVGFTLKAAYSSYSSAGGPGLSGRRTAYGDVFRLIKIGVGTSAENIDDLPRADQSSFFFGALDNANTGLVTAPVTP